ncbi:hypothetical protein KBD20_04895 [Candidatus Saccharibacteria bacterium]|nr:hypothetical protein [Candidatus Saccharibacteria bacterium]
MPRINRKPAGCQAEQYVGMSGASVFAIRPGLVRDGVAHAHEFYTGVAVCGDRNIQVTDKKSGKVEEALGTLTAAMCIDCPRNSTQQ